jgi:hypothetical protein
MASICELPVWRPRGSTTDRFERNIYFCTLHEPVCQPPKWATRRFSRELPAATGSPDFREARRILNLSWQ